MIQCLRLILMKSLPTECMTLERGGRFKHSNLFVWYGSSTKSGFRAKNGCLHTVNLVRRYNNNSVRIYFTTCKWCHFLAAAWWQLTTACF